VTVSIKKFGMISARFESNQTLK